MANGIQCPNCGGYKVSRTSGGWSCLGWIVGGAGALTVFYGVLMALLPLLAGAPEGVYLLVGSLVVGGGLVILGIRLAGTPSPTASCGICGYRWNVRETTSGPVKPRQDLIRKAHEEEERRRLRD